MIEQRDLLLVPFPFSDQSGRKVRPVAVVSNNDFNQYSQDIIVVGVTSNASRDRYALTLANNDLEEGKLLSSCCIRAENILKIEKELIIKRIGRIKKDKLKQIFDKIYSILK